MDIVKDKMTRGLLFKITSILSVLFSLSCSKDFTDFSTESGRRAAIEKTNNYLSSAMCDKAIETIRPLYESKYVDNEIRLITASAYGCKGGFDMVKLIDGIEVSGGGDIYATLVASNYSENSTDGKIGYLEYAASILRKTTGVLDENDASYYNAKYRNGDVNTLMFFIQAELIGLTISVTTIGNADKTTGKKRQSITGLGTTADKCRITVAIATINNISEFGNSGGAFTTTSTKITSACGGSCPVNMNPAICTIYEETQGQLLINNIDSQWNFLN